MDLASYEGQDTVHQFDDKEEGNEAPRDNPQDRFDRRNWNNQNFRGNRRDVDPNTSLKENVEEVEDIPEIYSSKKGRK